MFEVHKLSLETMAVFGIGGDMINIKTVKKEVYRGYTVVVKKHQRDEVINLLFIDKSEHLTWYCGYVVIPEDHPFYGLDYEEVEEDIDVHGGLTFSGEFEDVDGFLVGFDCAHAGDNPEVQDEEYTLSECKKLVDQLIEMEALSKTNEG